MERWRGCGREAGEVGAIEWVGIGSVFELWDLSGGFVLVRGWDGGGGAGKGGGTFS